MHVNDGSNEQKVYSEKLYFFFCWQYVIEFLEGLSLFKRNGMASFLIPRHIKHYLHIQTLH
jgi:hypothetical protein